jgi:general secretion pathway protein J
MMRGAAERSSSQAPRSGASLVSRAPKQPPRSEGGFTLLEVVIALAIVGALLAVAFGGLRVALSAWRKGEDRAEAHQHARTLTTVLARSIAGAYPYRISAEEAPEPVVQFDGQPDRLSFVTLAAPFPLAAPIAFTAVRFEIESGDEPGLAVRERALPNQDVFSKAAPVFRDPAVTALSFRYLRPGGDWEERWDGASEEGLPAAVQVSLNATLDGRATVFPPITISLRTVKPTS